MIASSEIERPSASGSRAEYAQLGQSLIEGVDESAPPAAATPMIEVVAPATLPENYTFDAKVGELSFMVQVPPGGVEQGQKFSVPMPGGKESIDESLIRPRISVPVGQWRDGVGDCCKFGCFHPLFWNAIFCVPITAAQVMTRLQLTWLGNPADNSWEARGTFRIIGSMVLSYFIIDRLMGIYIFGTIFYGWKSPYEEELDEIAVLLIYVRRILFCAYFLFGHVYLLKKLRAHVREKYAIPDVYGCPNGCEDLCCAFFCSWCTAAQIARHTADYETYRSVCCSDTGLPSHVPVLV